MPIKLLSALLTIVWCSLASVPAFARTTAAPQDPAIRSNAAYVFDETNASILIARHADVAAPIASITKLMTALVVLDARQPDDELLEIAKEDRATQKGATSRLPIGAKLTRGELLRLALMSSDNRAAHVVARHYPGGVEACVKAMNAKATALGMTRTRFVDPTGLSSQNVATPADLAKLVIAAGHNESIRDYSTARAHEVRVGKSVLEFRNTNYLVAKPEWNILVQKTGYLADAGKCLVMQAVIQGRTTVIVLLDSFGKYTRTADANRIRKWMEASTRTAQL